jgi:guanylate cyclase
MNLKFFKLNFWNFYNLISPKNKVFIGGHNISRDYTEIKKIKRIITHDEFDIFSFNNDIALLELETPIFYGPRVSPVCLPDGEQQDFTDQLTLVSGWGRLGEKLQTSTALRSVIVPIWSRDECLNANYGPSRITENMICGGFPEGKKDACQGNIKKGKIYELEKIKISHF